MGYTRSNSVPNFKYAKSKSRSLQRSLSEAIQQTTDKGTKSRHLQRSLSDAIEQPTDKGAQKYILFTLLDVLAHLRLFIKIFPKEWNLALPAGLSLPSVNPLMAVPQLKPLITGSMNQVSKLTLVQKCLEAMKRDVLSFLNPSHVQAALHDHNQIIDLLTSAHKDVNDVIYYINNHAPSVGHASSCPTGSSPECTSQASLPATLQFSRALQILAAADVLVKYLDTYS